MALRTRRCFYIKLRLYASGTIASCDPYQNMSVEIVRRINRHQRIGLYCVYLNVALTIDCICYRLTFMGTMLTGTRYCQTVRVDFNECSVQVFAAYQKSITKNISGKSTLISFKSKAFSVPSITTVPYIAFVWKKIVIHMIQAEKQVHVWMHKRHIISKENVKHISALGISWYDWKNRFSMN